MDIATLTPEEMQQELLHLQTSHEAKDKRIKTLMARIKTLEEQVNSGASDEPKTGKGCYIILHRTANRYANKTDALDRLGQLGGDHGFKVCFVQNA